MPLQSMKIIKIFLLNYMLMKNKYKDSIMVKILQQKDILMVKL